MAPEHFSVAGCLVLWLSQSFFHSEQGGERRGRLRHLLITMLAIQGYDEELLRYLLSALNSLNNNVL